MKKFLILLTIAILFFGFVEFIEYMLGADVVFIGALLSLPFVFAWCIITEYKLQKNKNVLSDND